MDKMKSRLYLFFHLLIFPGFSFYGFSQNLVPNPDFEMYAACPATFGTGGPLPASPWTSATSDGSPDYFNVCANPTWFGVPGNFFGVENPHSGVAYAGLYCYLDNTDYKEYLLAPLTEPLIAGTPYSVKFWISLADYTCGTSEIGAYLSSSPPPYNASGIVMATPQITTSAGILNDTSGWVLISGCVVALGGEAWITIGNFSLDVNTPIDPACSLSFVSSYYYIDDVSVEADTFAEVLFLDLGGPVSGCEHVGLNPGIQDVSYNWSTGSADTLLDITTSGIYSLTITSGCLFGRDTISASISSPPTIELGPAQIYICNGDTLGISFDPWIGNYVWQDGSTQPVNNISSPGHYAVTVTNACGVSTDEMDVQVINPPVFDLGQNITVCPALLPVTFDISGAINASSYVWQDGSVLSNYIAMSQGTYAVTISNVCFSTEDEVSVIVEDSNPVINLPPDQSLCPGQVLILDGSGVAGNYLWQDGSISDSFTITQSGTYALTITDQCGSGSDSISVFYLAPLAPPDLGPDTTICFGQQILLYAGVTGVSYRWQDMSTSDSLLVLSPGLCTLHISDMCSAADDSLELFMDYSLPSFQLPVSLPLCATDTIQLSAGISSGIFLWNDGTSAPELTVFNPGIYMLSVTNACGTNSDTINIVDSGSGPAVSLGQDISLCSGDTLVISPASTGVLSWIWQDGSADPEFIATMPGIIILSVSNDCGTTNDTLDILASAPVPSLDLGPDILACDGDTVTLHCTLADVSFLWQNGTNTSEYSVISSGDFILEIKNSCGVDVDTIHVEMNSPPAPNLGPDLLLCEGDSTVLVADVDASLSIMWQDGSGDSLYKVRDPGTYILFESNHCALTSDTVNVSFLMPPASFDLGPDTTLCPGASLLLMVPQTNLNIRWQDGSSEDNFIADHADKYFLQLSNQCGSRSDTISISVDKKTPVFNFANSIQWCRGDTISIDAGQSFNADYIWNDGSDRARRNFVAPGLYRLSIITACETIPYDITLVPGDDCAVSVYIPSIFSPNGDGANDHFFISFSTSVVPVSIASSIYDRWGNMVFSTHDPFFSWDGRQGDNDLQEGVYVYRIILEYDTGNRHRTETFSGDVSIIR